MKISSEQLAALQRDPTHVRNICILAHVDHGKTTLADTLVASNGIISQRLAGKLRYMDSREDEQKRGITMKSSAISLHYQTNERDFLINLIDSPGHIDFSSEVSTAVRLCDGALVLVDVIEGVCPQTYAVLRQAWLENIKPVLILNKIDRLILEWKMSPLEAYIHLQQILEQVNAVTGELFATTVLAQDENADSTEEQPVTDKNKVYDWSSGLDEADDEHLYFSPDQGNVVFASALDGWGFSIHHFADLWASKLGVKRDILLKTLWGDFYLNNKTKRIMKGAQAKGKKPLFVQFVLDNLWSVYDAVLVNRNKEMIEKIVKSLNLKIAPRDSRQADPKVHLHAICSQWLPLSKAVLAMVTDRLPCPLEMSPDRIEKLMCGPAISFDSLPKETQELKQAFLECSPSPEAPVIVFVSKMVPVERRLLPNNKPRALSAVEIAERGEEARRRHAERRRLEAEQEGEGEAPAQITTSQLQTVEEEGENGDVAEAEKDKPTPSGDDHVFIAFARVYSGTVKKGQRLYVLGPKHNPGKAIEEMMNGLEISPSLTLKDLSGARHMTSFVVEDLFMFMGRELENMESVPAGNVLGIGGLEDHILKSATISSTVACPAFVDMFFEAVPIVRVAIEPVRPGEMSELIQGLRLLNQADPCVQVLVQESGEHVIITAGEVHLQKCLDDLRQSYAKIELNVSKAIVPFRESIVVPPTVDRVNEAIQDQNQIIQPKQAEEEEQEGKDRDEEEDEEKEDDKKGDGVVVMQTRNKMCTMRLRAAPLPEPVTQYLDKNTPLIKTLNSCFSAGGDENNLKINTETKDALLEFKAKLTELFSEAGKEWANAVNEIWSFGPWRSGPNLLLNRVEGYQRPSVWQCLEEEGPAVGELRRYDSSVVSGFQLTTLAGPLCEEPMMGVCYIVEGWDMVSEAGQSSSATTELTTVTSMDTQGSVTSENSASEHGTEPHDRTQALKEKDTNGSDSDSIKSDRRKKKEGPFTGQLMSCVKEMCKKCFQSQPQRLRTAMYSCQIQATADVLGKMYAVFGKRNGRVLDEDMNAGSQTFNITAVLPVVESFGFAEEIRKRTSGLASPQLTFSHWEVVDIDPFWEPSTEEEYMHFGAKADSDNLARKYMNQVRKRKGLKVDEKLVEHAEKQRTLTRNK